MSIRWVLAIIIGITALALLIGAIISAPAKGNTPWQNCPLEVRLANIPSPANTIAGHLPIRLQPPASRW
jgi:hypothetical protein